MIYQTPLFLYNFFFFLIFKAIQNYGKMNLKSREEHSESNAYAPALATLILLPHVIAAKRF